MKSVARPLGGAFLFVLVGSALSTSLLESAVGSGGISEILVSVSGHVVLMRAAVLVGLATSVGIVALAALLYVALREQNRILALIALGWWWAEAITLAVSKVGALALVPLSQEFTGAGAPEASHFQLLGGFLHDGVLQHGDNIHMLFYSVGAVLWFYLLYRSRYVPRALSTAGLIIETVGLVGSVLLFCVANVNMWFFYPIAALELAIGLVLVIRGRSGGTGSG